MSDQDFKVVLLKKDGPKKKQVHYKKPEGDVTMGEEPLKKIGTDFKLALLKARTNKGLTQKELAAKLCVKDSVIRDYESGKVVPNGNLIHKINQELGITLPKCKRPK